MLSLSTLYTIINEPQVDNDMFNLRTAAESPSVPSRVALQGRYQREYMIHVRSYSMEIHNTAGPRHIGDWSDRGHPNSKDSDRLVLKNA